MPRPTFLPAAPRLREPLPDPLELLRQGIEGVALPMAMLDRWLDRMETAR